MSEDNNYNKHSYSIANIVIFIILAGLLIFVLIIILGGKTTTNTTDSQEAPSLDMLSCSASNPKNSIISPSGSLIKYDIRIVIKKDLVDTVNLIFESHHDNNLIAEQAKENYQAAYINYYTSHNISAESISHTYNTIENTVRIDFYVKSDQLNDAVANIFFLGDVKRDIDGVKITDARSALENNGFSCEMISK